MALSIPNDVKNQLEAFVAEFNKRIDYGYIVRYRGAHAYIDRKNYFGNSTPIFRLKYTGDINQWEFAIYKYSTERYDADEWFFPGFDHVDGTIIGALKAGLEAYPS